MESETFRKWLTQHGCTFEQHERGHGKGHAIVAIRRGDRHSEMPLVGSKKAIPHDVVERVRADLGLEHVELPGYPRGAPGRI